MKLAALALISAGFLSASTIVFIPQPTAGYLSGTTLLPITDPEGSIIGSISDATLTISFLSGSLPILMDVNSVPGSWATWGSSPDTEGSTPIVLRPDDFLTGILFQFSQPLTTFGMELEPDDLGTHDITATFLFGGNTVGTLQRSVSGNAGALLFAATGDIFDSVSVSSDVDFAAAQFRYTPAAGTTIVPEPSFLLLLSGFAGIGAWKARTYHGSSSAK